MDKHYSKQFFNSFLHAIQQVCKTYLDFDEMVEVSGYVAVEIDNSQRERYVLCELLHASGNVFSESYCTKVFRTVKPSNLPKEDLIRYGHKRKSTESLDKTKYLIPLKSPFLATSGSDCSIGRGSSGEGTPSDTNANNNHSRNFSPVASLGNKFSQRRYQQSRADSASSHTVSDTLVPSDEEVAKHLYGVSETLHSSTDRRNQSVARVASVGRSTSPSLVQSQAYRSTHLMSTQTAVPVNISCANQISSDNSKVKNSMVMDLSLSSKQGMLVDWNSIAQSKQGRHHHPRHLDSGSGPGEMGNDDGLSNIIGKEKTDSSSTDTVCDTLVDRSVLPRKTVPKKPKVKTARMKTTSLQLQQQAVLDMRQNLNSEAQADIDPCQSSSVRSSPLTVDTKQPQVLLCNIIKLEGSRKAVCKKKTQSCQPHQETNSLRTAVNIGYEHHPSDRSSSEEVSEGAGAMKHKMKSRSCTGDGQSESSCLSLDGSADSKESICTVNLKVCGYCLTGKSDRCSRHSKGQSSEKSSRTAHDHEKNKDNLKERSHDEVPLPLAIVRSDENIGFRTCADVDTTGTRSEVSLQNVELDNDEDEENEPEILMVEGHDAPQENGEDHMDQKKPANSSSLEDTDTTNVHTAKKTKFHLKLLSKHLNSLGETRPVHIIPCKELDSYLGSFFAAVRRDNGEDYGSASIGGIQASIDRHLRKMQYPYSIKRDQEFAQSRGLLLARQTVLSSKGSGHKRGKVDLITQEEVDVLYDKGQLGTSSPDAVLNTVWFINNIHWGLRYSADHYNLRWGDIKLQVDESGHEYLEMTRGISESGSPGIRVYAQTDNPSRCCVATYKMYRSVRPEETCTPDSPFYLTVNHYRSGVLQSWFKFQNAGLHKLCSIMRRMAAAAGLDKEKFTNTAVRMVNN